MSELILGVVILALVGFIAWREKLFVQEKKDLLAAKLSENATEFKILTTPPRKEEKTEEVPSEFVPTSALSDDEFFEVIKKSNEG
jgi:hypothetical protein